MRSLSWTRCLAQRALSVRALPMASLSLSLSVPVRHTHLAIDSERRFAIHSKRPPAWLALLAALAAAAQRLPVVPWPQSRRPSVTAGPGRRAQTAGGAATAADAQWLAGRIQGSGQRESRSHRRTRRSGCDGPAAARAHTHKLNWTRQPLGRRRWRHKRRRHEISPILSESLGTKRAINHPHKHDRVHHPPRLSDQSFSLSLSSLLGCYYCHQASWLDQRTRTRAGQPYMRLDRRMSSDRALESCIQILSPSCSRHYL